ncbi:hypothetical protein BDR03DRAFT_987420 [Suillus americanus]|nr:hypothetical protein BDR03DRAFT_987420 [Suillus americanus]
MSSSGPTLAQIEVVAIVLSIVAVIVTSFRLCIRARQKRLWIDDAWAALCMIFHFILLIVDCLYLQDYGLPNYFTQLYVPGTFVRRVLISTAITFGIVWALLFSQALWVCESESGWKTQSRPQCDLGRGVATAQIITDVLGDLVLILAPFSLLYKIRLSTGQKVRVLAVFSASVITTIVSLTHAYYIFSGRGTKEGMAATVEASMSLIVANLSVVVAFIFHLKAEEDSPAIPIPIITFGSQPRKRVRDPLATTFTDAESIPIVLEGLSESGPRSLKTGDDDEISVKQQGGKADE